MYYDDTSRRLNLLSGLVFGTVLGAGLALLFLPGERMDTGRRVVVRAARAVGRTARGGAEAARDRVNIVRGRADPARGGASRTLRERLAEARARRSADGNDGAFEDASSEDAAAEPPERPIEPTPGVARRRFTL
jgi:hypothetical protein